jgi:hypothetical protein
VELKFNELGFLEPGDYELTFQEIQESILVREGEISYWDESWRRFLIGNCEVLVKQLWQVGIQDIFIDGSFVTDKGRPEDIDGYFVLNDLDEMLDLQSQLNDLDPYCCWTWHPEDRIYPDDDGSFHFPMWRYYRVELFPDCLGAYTGLNYPDGRRLKFPQLFRVTRNFETKGIIKIVKG